jgi:hypothetical protein
MSLLADRSPKSVAGRTEFRKLWQTGTVRGANNALDEAEEAGVAPEIDIQVEGTKIIYASAFHRREAYVSPTRGAQGNALKTILSMGYVLNEKLGEDASGEPPLYLQVRTRQSTRLPSRRPGFQVT